MTIISRLFGAGAVVAIFCACARFPASQPPAGREPLPAAEEASIERAVHDLVNTHRAAAGLRPLEWNSLLAGIADEHSEAMAAGTRPLGHAGFYGRAAAVQQALFTSQLSENVATNWNYPLLEVPGQVVDSWIDSPDHHRNMVGNHRLSGVGVARSDSGEYFVTQLYAGP